MAKTLNFNSLKKPTLPLVMKDDANTNIPVTTPMEGLVEELQAAGTEMKQIFETNDVEGVRMCYDLAARLISCNLIGLNVTADDLRKKYRLDVYDLIFFFEAYTSFLNEIHGAKN